ncbi:MAG: glycosyltransferase [Pseudomonadota bacterium]
MADKDVQEVVDVPKAAPLALTEDQVDQIDIVIAMRFAFFGKSGWKSDTSRDKELLFDKERLSMRLHLLKTVALASLAAQDDQNFHLFILTSEDLPEDAFAQLRAVCEEMLQPAQYTIHARPPAYARKFLRLFMQQKYKSGPIMQVVLDDDDGLSSDYISRLRKDMRSYLPEVTKTNTGPQYISYSHGYGLAIGEDPSSVPELYQHAYPYINLGLAMLSTLSEKNIFAIDHQGAPKRAGCHMVKRVAMWVRSVHFTNDSRVEVGDRWRKLDDWPEHPDVKARFSYLDPKQIASLE